MDEILKEKRLFAEFPHVTTEEWEAKIYEDLKGADYDKKLIWKTTEGFSVKPYYREEDLRELESTIGMPGKYFFSHGNKKKDNTWLIRQDILHTDLTQANSQAVDAIARGATAISFDTSEIKSSVDFGRLFTGIDLYAVFLHLHSYPSYSKLLDCLGDYLKANKLDAKKLKGSIDFDPVSFALLHGHFYDSPEKDMSEAAAIVKRANAEFPGLRVLAVNGSYFHNSGSTSVQELAFSLASGNEYLAILTGKGIDVAHVAPFIQFSFCIGSSYFMEIARLRAARLLWAQIVKKYSPESKSVAQMHIHSSTSGWNKTIYDPYTNLLRSTTEIMSAAIGGTDSMSVDPFDLYYKEPDEISMRIARNQQIILKEESYLDKVIDPAAGSYFIESLTESIAKSAWKLFLAVEEKGGMVKAIESGFIQDEVEKASEFKQAEVSARRTIVLGTNHHPNPGEYMLEKIQEEIVLNEPDEPNSTPIKKLNIHRLSDAFEDLRLATEIFVASENKRPAVFHLTIGNAIMRKARAAFSSNFFGCAGYQIIDNDGFTSVDEAVDVALESNAEIIVICGADEDYPEFVPVIAKKLKDIKKELIVLVAGYPKDIIEHLISSGVDDFVHLRTNMLEFQQKMQMKLGIIVQVS